MAYADHPLGPWKKDPRGKLFLGGHLAVFNGPDNRKWFSYRGESRNKAHGLVCIAPFDVDASGTIKTIAPTIGEQVAPPEQTGIGLRK